MRTGAGGAIVTGGKTPGCPTSRWQPAATSTRCGPCAGFYRAVLPLCEARAKLYHGVAGAYFPETMTIFGTYANKDYGWDRRGHQPERSP